MVNQWLNVQPSAMLHFLQWTRVCPQGLLGALSERKFLTVPPLADSSHDALEVILLRLELVSTQAQLVLDPIQTSSYR
jgi:hypothetical protein